MAGWPDARMTTSETLIGSRGAFVLFRGATHFKLALVGERLRQAKAFIVWLLCLPQALAGQILTTSLLSTTAVQERSPQLACSRPGKPLSSEARLYPHQGRMVR